jgi:hypothetical protein
LEGDTLKGIILGIRKHPWDAFVCFFASFSVLWTLVEGLTYFVPDLDLHGIPSLAAVLVIGAIYSVSKVRRPSSVTFNISHTNTKIAIKFSDLFKEEGVRVIAVNEFFDSEIGLPVSGRSLHGIFLSKCFGGHPQAFDKMILDDLAQIGYETETRIQGKLRKYPIGTTALVPVNTDRYLCFALCRTELATCKAQADVPTLWRALEGLYSKARNCLGGAPLVLPLVGSGLSGIGLPARDLLDLIVLSLITESKQKQVTTLIKIILTFDRFEEIDLSEIKRYWR